MKRVRTGRFGRSLRLLSLIMLLGAYLLPVRPALAAPAETIAQIPTPEKVMVLTFDAGSDRGFAAQILNTLAANGIKAVFGMTGQWAEQNPDLVKRMVADGHQLINHSWNHPDFTTISTAERTSQLSRTQQLVQQLTGYDMRPYFRPPFGAYNAAVLNDLDANGYRYSIMWTVDTLGWNGASVATITSRTLNAAAPGAIVLMHVGAASADAAALPGIIDQLRSMGYRFDTAAHLLSAPAPTAMYFPQTGHWLSHGFLSYWKSYGGLAVFGYPITGEYTDPRTGFVTQYFERARFEWHPGAWPGRYDVLLGLLGNELAEQQGLRDSAPFQPVTATSDTNCTYYAATGHRLCSGFRDFWNAHGGLAIYGYPLSDEFTDPSTGLTVQYFERQRLEYHPTNPPAYRVLGGLLGVQLYSSVR